MTLDLDLNIFSENFWPELEKVAIENNLPVAEIQKAYDYALLAHQGQRRESGEAYITHPIWVAKVCAQLGVGEKAVVAALLHDCVEDTNITVNDIANEFGDEVALLVEGMTEVKKKTSGIEIHQTNIEVFRRFLFSSVDDVRVLIIRLVDKLHNGMTIKSLSPERQIKYAKRVFGIYGPVAEYVGLHYFKRLLEDIAFKILYPKEAKELDERISERKREEIKALGLVKNEINQMAAINHINNYEIQGRIKSLYGSFLKKKLLDRVGVRILVESVADCYTVLGLLHAKFEYLPNEFDDYISSPKPNGYRSIQTTLNWKNKLTVEVQIRTFQMHEFNEFGPASHIAYKMSKGTTGVSGVGYEWVKELVNWQTGGDKIKNYRISVLDKFIYVFTPKGDTIQLPKGSTVIDFAYQIHSNLGDRCKGAMINNNYKGIDTVLKTGDLIEIIATKKPIVNKNWLNIVVSSNAREHIRKAIHLTET
ncbi:MAG TPA: HD domain-containing protein [Candidatus Woesebacteria bacterium]|nr:HD domain-containing protein [Candidatus Woesebacteria bacterium]HPJ16947.1 HD domain-containing protein [Candidatus Woesebacteria bacterium]